GETDSTFGRMEGEAEFSALLSCGAETSCGETFALATWTSTASGVLGWLAGAPPVVSICSSWICGFSASCTWARVERANGFSMATFVDGVEGAELAAGAT